MEPTLNRRDLLALLAGGALLPARVFSRDATPPPLSYASLSDVAKLIESKSLSPTDLTRQLLDRIAALDGRLHSYVTVMADHAMASARRAEAEIKVGRYRGPLHGVPIGVKDLCYTRGVRTMAGTKVLSEFVPDFDATLVARLEAAGAIILGKLTLCEGAFGPYHPDLQVPVNPWDPTRWSGVSSSGSGVATAAGLCFASVGSDTGGSIMANAAFPKLLDPSGVETDEGWSRLVMNDVHTKPFNFSGSPTLSVPCGFSANGLPLSVQFVGRRLSEAVLCRVGFAFEQATQWHLRHPPM